MGYIDGPHANLTWHCHFFHLSGMSTLWWKFMRLYQHMDKLLFVLDPIVPVGVLMGLIFCPSPPCFVFSSCKKILVLFS